MIRTHFQERDIGAGAFELVMNALAEEIVADDGCDGTPHAPGG